MWIYLLIIGALIILAFLPFNLVIAPERKLQILDNNGNPLSDVIVRQIWDQYSLGEHGRIDLKTDSEGKVVTPKRVVRTSIIALFRGGIKELKSLGIHASYDSSESIGIFVDGYPDKWFYDGKGLEAGKISGVESTHFTN